MHTTRIAIATALLATSLSAQAAPDTPAWRTQMHADTSAAIAQQGNLALQLIGKAAAERLRDSIPALIRLDAPSAQPQDTPDSPAGQ